VTSTWFSRQLPRWSPFLSPQVEVWTGLALWLERPRHVPSPAELSEKEGGGEEGVHLSFRQKWRLTYDPTGPRMKARTSSSVVFSANAIESCHSPGGSFRGGPTEADCKGREGEDCGRELLALRIARTIRQGPGCICEPAPASSVLPQGSHPDEYSF